MHPYSTMLDGGVRGTRIAIVTEGFKQPNGEKVVNEKVYNAARRLQELGAKVDEVSLPMHTVGPAIWTPIGVEGLTQTMMWGDDRKSTRLNSSHITISYAVFCLKKKKKKSP